VQHYGWFVHVGEANALERQEKEKEDVYLQDPKECTFLKHLERSHQAPHIVVVVVDGVAGEISEGTEHTS